MTAALWTIAAITGLAAGVYGVVRLTRMRSTERIHCPTKDIDVDVGFERELRADWSPGERVDVACCSAFENPHEVTCEKECVHERRAAARA
jgi:hypothetical protein